MEDFKQFATNRLVENALELMKDSPEQARAALFFAGVGGNDPAALYHLGVMEMTGKGGEKNVGDGIAHLQQSADAGYADAAFYLGWAYFWGKEVEQDYGRAFPLLKKAAELGHVEACNCLVECYKDGKGVGKDMAKSLEWLSIYVERKNLTEGNAADGEDSELGDPDLLEEGAAAYLLLQANGLNPDDFSPWSEFRLEEYCGKGTDASDPFVISDGSNAVSYEDHLIEYLSSGAGYGDTSFEILDSEVHWDGKTAVDYVSIRVYEEPLAEGEEKSVLYDKTLYFDVTANFKAYNESMGVTLPDSPMVYGQEKHPEN